MFDRALNTPLNFALKRDTDTGYFSFNFAKFFRAAFFSNIMKTEKRHFKLTLRERFAHLER